MRLSKHLLLVIQETIKHSSKGKWTPDVLLDILVDGRNHNDYMMITKAKEWIELLANEVALLQKKTKPKAKR